MPSSSSPSLARPSALSTRSLNRQILALAVPAFGALVAEPLFVLGDTAIVGHLGTEPLAGLTLGATVIQTLVGLMIFLSYSTTPAVARAFGAGDLHAAYVSARDGLWAALLVGVVLALGMWFFAEPLLRAMGGGGEVLGFALDYLRLSLLGLPAMLIVLAAVGTLRGLQDTKTPLYVASVGALINLLLSWFFVYPVGLGVAGSAIATATVQWGMAAVMGWIVLRGMHRHGVGVETHFAGIFSVFRVGSWLMLRTLTMRIALLATVFVVTAQGSENLAAYQLTMSFFNLLAFSLDSLAIAAQALLGKEMGAQDLGTEQGRAAVIELKNRLIRWSLGFGVILGILCPIIGFAGGWIFTPDPAVQHLFALATLVIAVGQPIAAYVFILDGVLIGAQDVRYLALVSIATLAFYVPLLAAVHLVFAKNSHEAGSIAFVALWISYALGYMGARALTLGLRARQAAWVK
ncbi:MAG: MATE family efflux transporter [Rothia sp. (in: high G+C Gram-positive bacteria)]|nr:MATE family efflux transporter [Rothia sp. (in: high G+C Gram-positive bacteria)]